MSRAAKRAATYDDLLKVPEPLRAEIVAGDLYAAPRPAGPHGRAADVLHRQIGRAFDDGDGGPGGWWIAAEPEVHLDGDVFVPDVAGVRRERIPEFPAGPAWELVPDWACEVLSPSTRRMDRMVKMPAYARHGLEWLWLVDPTDQLIEVYCLRDGRYVSIAVHGGEERVRIEPFDAIEVDLARLWLMPPAPSS